MVKFEKGFSDRLDKLGYRIIFFDDDLYNLDPESYRTTNILIAFRVKDGSYSNWYNVNKEVSVGNGITIKGIDELWKSITGFREDEITVEYILNELISKLINTK